ncbi:MAG: ADP-forming succinate--CoA ligase subunit beta [Nitrospirae bacterium]|nr:ADP-forming succinate--CoA ligase subunit beta [Nitrospirota bacterium]
MRLHEYQAKEIIAKTGIRIPAGKVVSSAAEAREAYEVLGLSLGVVKAQAHTGGRGKAGGILTAHSPVEAYSDANAILGRRLVTVQSGPDGVPVRKVLVEEGLAVEREYYLAITIDREKALPVIIASSAGGMDIEEAARREPGRVVKEYIEPVFGLQPYQARKMAYSIGVPRGKVNSFVDIMLKLHIVFLVSDAELVEINPLVLVESDDFVALDAKMSVDDSALYRHEDMKRLADPSDMDGLEYRAKKAGVSYVRMDGNIGCMVNGAGLAMATMDLVKGYGGEPANFLDVGGGAAAGRIKDALEILLSDRQVEAVLINIFGGILRCDELARGVVAAAGELAVNVPVVVRLEGTNRDEGARILRESGLSFKVAHSMREAGEMVVGCMRSNA